jgi:hypothetical protein
MAEAGAALQPATEPEVNVTKSLYIFDYVYKL